MCGTSVIIHIYTISVALVTSQVLLSAQFTNRPADLLAPVLSSCSNRQKLWAQQPLDEGLPWGRFTPSRVCIVGRLLGRRDASGVHLSGVAWSAMLPLCHRPRSHHNPHRSRRLRCHLVSRIRCSWGRTVLSMNQGCLFCGWLGAQNAMAKVRSGR